MQVTVNKTASQALVTIGTPQKPKNKHHPGQKLTKMLFLSTSLWMISTLLASYMSLQIMAQAILTSFPSTTTLWRAKNLASFPCRARIVRASAEGEVSKRWSNDPAPLTLFLSPPGCWTVDGSFGDDALECSKRALDPIGLNTSTQQAVKNISDCARNRPAAHIVGHGNDGFIITGGGISPQNEDQYISLWNEAYWGPPMRMLRDRISSLNLWACHPGAGDAGAEFLFHVAKIVNAPVAGPTGYITCTLSLEAGSTWQVATPTQRPIAIGAPSPHMQFFASMVFQDNGKSISIPLAQVTRIEYTRSFPLERVFGTIPPNTRKLAGEKAQDVLRLIDLEHPFYSDPLLAVVTGHLAVFFSSTKDGGSKTENHILFMIYNDRLLFDQKSGAYYNASGGLRTTLALL